MENEEIKVGNCVEAVCIHKQVGKVRGIVVEIHGNTMGVIAIPARVRNFHCYIAGAVLIPDEELDEEIRAAMERARLFGLKRDEAIREEAERLKNQ